MKKFGIIAPVLCLVFALTSCINDHEIQVKFYLHNGTDTDISVVQVSSVMNSIKEDSVVVAPDSCTQFGKTVFSCAQDSWYVLPSMVNVDTVRIYINGTKYNITKKDVDGCQQRDAYRVPTYEEYFVEYWEDKTVQFYLYDITQERLDAIRIKQDAE